MAHLTVSFDSRFATIIQLASVRWFIDAVLRYTGEGPAK